MRARVVELSERSIKRQRVAVFRVAPHESPGQGERGETVDWLQPDQLLPLSAENVARADAAAAARAEADADREAAAERAAAAAKKRKRDKAAANKVAARKKAKGGNAAGDDGAAAASARGGPGGAAGPSAAEREAAEAVCAAALQVGGRLPPYTELICRVIYALNDGPTGSSQVRDSRPRLSSRLSSVSRAPRARLRSRGGRFPAESRLARTLRAWPRGPLIVARRVFWRAAALSRALARSRSSPRRCARRSR